MDGEFAHKFVGLGARCDSNRPGVWLDLAKHVYYFPEEQVGSLGDGLWRRWKSSAKDVKGLDTHQPVNRQVEPWLHHGRKYSSDEDGDGPAEGSKDFYYFTKVCEIIPTWNNLVQPGDIQSPRGTQKDWKFTKQFLY